MKYTTIKEHHLFDKTFKKGKRFVGKYFSLFILKDYAASKLKNENPCKKEYNRLGVSVSKKIGCAVKRSRAKRLLRLAYRTVEPKMKTGYLVVISPRDAILNAKSNEVTREMFFAIRKLEMLNDVQL